MGAASREIPYNLDVLRWARERSRLDQFEAAHLASTTPEKIKAWEDGSSAPTVRQARLLASAYNRPFLEFFFPNIPVIPKPVLAPDFRFRSLVPDNLETAALEGYQEWAEAQRLNALDLYETLGEPPPRFPEDLHSTTGDDPETSAACVRARMGFPVDTQLRLRSNERYKFPTMVRHAIESLGVLVLKQSGLSKTRTRGICLYHPILPVIVFGNETPGGQAFTLVHEFAHIFLGQSAVSGAPIIAYKHGNHRRKVEGWCNAFAAAFLMPADAVKSHRHAPPHFVESIPDAALASLANSFAVSRHAMLIRLVTLGLVDPRFYWRVKRPQFLMQDATFPVGGRSEYYGSRFRNTLGDLYTGLVIEALGTGRLGYHSASEFMGIKNVRHLQEIQRRFGD